MNCFLNWGGFFFENKKVLNEMGDFIVFFSIVCLGLFLFKMLFFSG